MFYPLNETNTVEYIARSPVAATVFAGVHDLKVIDLAAGNINLIFRVYSESDPIGKSVLIKQALTYAWRYPDFKVPQERAALEYEVLSMEGHYCPGMVPNVYHYDPEMFVNIMEDLNQHIIMRQGLMKQVRYPHFAEHMGVFLARTQFYTSDFFLSSADKKKMVGRFLNPVMCKVTEDLVFTQPYIRHPNNHWSPPLTPHVEQIYADEALRIETLFMKEAFMTHAESLVHGDLHTGSILINQEETRIIDPEFAYFGPMGFDIGAVLGNLLLSYASQEWHASDPSERLAYRLWLLDTILQVWQHFEKEFRLLYETLRNDEWHSDQFVDQFLLRLLRDTAGFGACKAMRRILGMAHVPDLETIPDDAVRARAESMALNAARSWLVDRKSLNSVNDLVGMIAAARPNKNVG